MIGSEGTAGCGVTVNAVAVLVHPLLFLAVTLYIPATTPVNIPVVLVYVEPSILNVRLVIDELTLIVPVLIKQLGCAVTLAVGAAGIGGCGRTVTLTAGLTILLKLLEVTL